MIGSEKGCDALCEQNILYGYYNHNLKIWQLIPQFKNHFRVEKEKRAEIGP